MIKHIIKDIIENFIQQAHLYKEMEDLAGQQLVMLQSDAGKPESEGLNSLLAERQSLLSRINEINQKNKQLQQEAVNKLGIDEFVLTGLEKLLSKEDYNDLKSGIAKLGRLLESINEKDLQSQTLMQQGLLAARNKSGKTSSQQASMAYKQAMAQKFKKQ